MGEMMSTPETLTESRVEESLPTPPPESAVTPEQAETPTVPDPEGEEEDKSAPPADVSPPLPEGWNDHPEVKELVTGSYDKAKSDLDKAHRKATRTQIAELEDTLDSVHQQDLQRVHKAATAGQIVTRMAETLRDADPTDAVQMWGVIQQSEEWAEAFNGSRYVGGMNDIFKALVASDELVAGLDDELLDDFADERRKINLRLRREEVPLDQPKALAKNLALMQSATLELLAARDKIRDAVIVKTALDKERARLDVIAKKAAGASNRADERGKGSPPAPPNGRGGKGSYTMDQIRTMTREQVAAIPKDELDRILSS